MEKDDVNFTIPNVRARQTSYMEKMQFNRFLYFCLQTITRSIEFLDTIDQDIPKGMLRIQGKGIVQRCVKSL